MFDHSEFVASILASDPGARGSVVGWTAPDVWLVTPCRPVESVDAAAPVGHSDPGILCW